MWSLCRELLLLCDVSCDDTEREQQKCSSDFTFSSLAKNTRPTAKLNNLMSKVHQSRGYMSEHQNLSPRSNIIP